MSSPQKPEVTALQYPQCGAGLGVPKEAYILCQYCSPSLVLGGPNRAAPDSPDNLVRGMLLKELVFTGTQGTGLEMFRCPGSRASAIFNRKGYVL